MVGDRLGSGRLCAGTRPVSGLVHRRLPGLGLGLGLRAQFGLGSISRWLALGMLSLWGLWAQAQPQLQPRPQAASQETSAPDLRFAAPPAAAPDWLLRAGFTPEDRALAAQLPALRVAVLQGGQPPFVRVDNEGLVSGLQVDLLAMLAAHLGLTLQPVPLPHAQAAEAALREGRVDVLLLVRPPASGGASLAYSLGSGALPMAVIGQRESAPVPLPRARVAVVEQAGGDGSGRDHYVHLQPHTQFQPHADALAALQAVGGKAADLYAGSLVAALEALARHPVPGLELRQVVPGAAGHAHFAVSPARTDLLTVLNKGVLAWRSTPLGHQALMRVLHAYAPQLRAPLALPLQGPDASQASVMSSLVTPSFELRLGALTVGETQALAETSSWRVGVLKGPGDLNHLDSQGQHIGIAAGQLLLLAQRLGVVLQRVPFEDEAAMHEALLAGRIDWVPLMVHNPAAVRRLEFSLPWLELPRVLVGRENAGPIWDLASLRARKVALSVQHPQREEIRQKFDGIQWVDAPSAQAALSLLAEGQVDAALEFKLTVHRSLASAEGQGLRMLAAVDEGPAQFRFAASDKARAWIPQVDAALADISAEQQQGLLRRWVAHDLDPSPASPWGLGRLWPWALGSLLAVGLGAMAWRHQRRRRLARADQPSSWYAPWLRERSNTQQAPAAFDDTVCVPTVMEAPVAEGMPAVEPAEDAWAKASSMREERGPPAAETPVPWPARPAAWVESADQALRASMQELNAALQALPMQSLPPALVQPLSHVCSAALDLSQQLDHTLDAAKLGAGAIALCEETVDLEGLMRGVVGAYRSAADSRQLRLSYVLDDALPLRVKADAGRLRQVLMVLVDQAVTRTGSGRVLLRARLENAPDSPSLLVLDVRDTGVGLVPGDPRLRLGSPVMPEQNVDASDVNRTESVVPPVAPAVNLNLDICKDLVALMRGTIELRSVAGKGSLVRLRLPLRLAQPAQAVRPEGLVLICEADALLRSKLAKMVSTMGYGVVEAESPAQALRLWRERSVRAVIVEVDAPDQGPSPLIAELRVAEAQARYRTAALVYSRLPRPDAAQADPLVDAWLLKPVDRQALQRTLRALLGAPVSGVLARAMSWRGELPAVSATT